VKVAVVTGASAGIGEAAARALARDGWTLVLAARREDRLRALARELPDALPVRCDVTVREDLETLAREVDRAYGRCDLLVNNAGIPADGWFAKVSLEQLDLVLDTNLRSVVWATKLFLPLLERSKGHVINVASLAGRYAFPGAAIYTATKHAVVALSEALYHELGPRGVAVTSLNPGFVETERFTHDDLRSNPRTRRFVMPPERVARAIVEVARTRKGPEVSVPRWLGSFQAFRVLTPPLYHRAVGRLARLRRR